MAWVCRIACVRELSDGRSYVRPLADVFLEFQVAGMRLLFCPIVPFFFGECPVVRQPNGNL